MVRDTRLKGKTLPWFLDGCRFSVYTFYLTFFFLFFADDGSNVRRAIDAGYPYCLYTPSGFHFATWLEAAAALTSSGGGAPAAPTSAFPSLGKALDFGTALAPAKDPSLYHP
jgi:hypothetical protein